MAKGKVITILGVGGHGSSAMDDLLTRQTVNQYELNSDTELDEIHLVLGVDDSGGHTGWLYKVLSQLDLGINPNQLLPMGDLRSIIERFLFYTRGDEASRKMGERYKGTDTAEFIGACVDFCNQIGFVDPDFCEGFIGFCKRYFNKFKELGFDPAVKHSIGNLFLAFIHIQKGLDINKFFAELKNLGLIPENIHPHFFYNKRLTLEATNLNTGLKFVTEEAVDEAQIHMGPGTYKLIDEEVGEAIGIAEIERNHPELLEVMQRSEAIVFSTGSIANLFGQLNVLAPYLKEYPGLILWLGNIARTRNEADFVDLLLFFLTGLHLEGVVMQMNENDFKNLTMGGTDWVERYRDQGKEFVNIPSMNTAITQSLNYNGFTQTKNLVQPVLGVTIASQTIRDRIPGWDSLTPDEQEELKVRLGTGGIKYITNEVTLFIDFFYELYNFLHQEVGIESRHEKYRWLSTQLGRLNFVAKEDAEINQQIAILRHIIRKEMEPIQKLQEIDLAIALFAGEVSMEVQQEFEQTAIK